MGNIDESDNSSFGFLRAHDDLFQKQIITSGSKDYLTPVEGSTCEFTLENLIDENNCAFPSSPLQVGFHNSFPSYLLSRALQTMTLNEKSRFSAQYGREWISFEVWLLSFEEKPEVYTWTKEHKLDMCHSLKKLGGDLFKKNDYLWSFHNYQRSLVFLSFTKDSDDEMMDLKAQLISNIALCQSNLKPSCSEKPILNLTLVLQMEPNNVKALFRRAKHFLSLNDFERAEEDIEKAYALDPANAKILEQKQLLKKKMQEHDGFTASAMAKFFGSK